MDLSREKDRRETPNGYENLKSYMGGKRLLLLRRVSDGKIVTIKKVPKQSEVVYRNLMNHHYKGIPEVLDIIIYDSYICVIEEYIEGRDIRAILDEGYLFSEKEAKAIITSLISILKPLHAQRPSIIHRDIKPENIILDNNGKVWLIDWGAAKKENGNKSRDTVLMGTEGYAAPEQYGFSQSDPSTDIYALGVLFNELITGHLPTIKKCKGKLREIVDKCTEIDKSNRYENVDELRKALLNKGPQRWLLPGFRGKGILKKLASAFLYYLLAYSCFTMEIDNSRSNGDTILNRVFAFIIFFSIVLFLGNWADMWAHIPLMKSDNKRKKVIGLILWPFLIIIFFMTIFTILEQYILSL